MAAVHHIPAAIGIGASTVVIPLHRHSAGLTVFVHSFHAVEFEYIQDNKFRWKSRQMRVLFLFTTLFSPINMHPNLYCIETH